MGASIHTDWFDDFINSQPKIRNSLNSLSTLTVQDAVSLQQSLESDLSSVLETILEFDIKNPFHDRLTELARFNYDRPSTRDSRFLANLLLCHVIERPWILESDFLQALTRQHSKNAQNAAKPLFTLKGPFCLLHLQCDSLWKLARRHGVVQNREAPRTWLVPFPLLNNDPRPSGDLPAAMDHFLGISGSIPLFSLHHSTEDLGVQHGEDSVRVRCLREMNGLVKLCPDKSGGSHHVATVSFSSDLLGLTSLEVEKAFMKKDPGITRLLHRVRVTMAQFETALSYCHDRGMILGGIPFLKIQHDKTNQVGLALTTLPISKVLKFFSLFEKFEKGYTDSSVVTSPAERFFFGGGIGIGLSMGALGVLTGGTGLAVAGAVVAGANAAVKALERDPLSLFTKSASPMFQSIVGILSAAGLNFGVVDLDEHRVAKLLHYSTLALQCLSLALQAAVRGLRLPFDHNLLSAEVSKYCLEGTRMGPIAYGVEAKLACLGRMIGGPALLFRWEDRVPPPNLLVLASLRDVMATWGPGAMKIVKAPGTDSLGVERVSVGGGILRASRGWTSAEGLPRWHWEPDGTGKDWPDSRAMNHGTGGIVDLHISVLIGADTTTSFSQAAMTVPMTALSLSQSVAFTSSQLNPIGPCHTNPSCLIARDNEAYERVRDIMAPYMVELGTYKPYWRLSSRGFTATVAKYVGVGMSYGWTREQGKNVKDDLLDEKSSESQLINALDQNSGLLVSSHTRVMTRVRLRDVIALVGPVCFYQDFPLLRGDNRSDSVLKIVQWLQGLGNISDWPDKDGISSGLTTLILAVLRRLEMTGVRPGDKFVTGWASQSGIKAVNCPISSNSWISMIQDSPHAATFACVTPHCLQTDSRRCSVANSSSNDCSLLGGLDDFVLSTRVILSCDLASGSQGSPIPRLQAGCSYLVHSRSVGLAASVTCVPSGSSRGEIWYLKVGKAARFTGSEGLSRRLRQRNAAYICESNERTSLPCFVSAIIEGPQEAASADPLVWTS